MHLIEPNTRHFSLPTSDFAKTCLHALRQPFLRQNEGDDTFRENTTMDPGAVRTSLSGLVLPE
jgi:hypothetical protein